MLDAITSSCTEQFSFWIRKNMTKGQAEVHKKSAYHHGDLRAQLVEATRQLVEEKGPSGFNVTDAARQAAVSTAAPYRHFKDRTALLHAVAEDGMHRLAASFDARIADLPPGSAEAITELGCAYVDFAASQPGVFRLMFAAHEEKPESLSQAGMACYGRLLQQTALHLGTAPEDAATSAVALPLWMFVHGASFLVIDGKLSETLAGGGLRPLIDQSTRRLLANLPPPDTN